MVTGEGALAKAERVNPSCAEGQSSSPKKDDVYMTVSPDFRPAFAAFPEADCMASKVRYGGFYKATQAALHLPTLTTSPPLGPLAAPN